MSLVLGSCACNHTRTQTQSYTQSARMHEQHMHTTSHTQTQNTRDTVPTHAHTLFPLSLQVISKKEFNSLLGPASMHALGHIAANLSFAAVAISLTHTVKTLEPAFNVLLTRVVLGEATPLPALLSLIPIMVRSLLYVCVMGCRCLLCMHCRIFFLV